MVKPRGKVVHASLYTELASIALNSESSIRH
jgi:hypothetical protein